MTNERGVSLVEGTVAALIIGLIGFLTVPFFANAIMNSEENAIRAEAIALADHRINLVKALADEVNVGYYSNIASASAKYVDGAGTKHDAKTDTGPDSVWEDSWEADVQYNYLECSNVSKGVIDALLVKVGLVPSIPEPDDPAAKVRIKDTSATCSNDVITYTVKIEDKNSKEVIETVVNKIRLR